MTAPQPAEAPLSLPRRALRWLGLMLTDPQFRYHQWIVRGVSRSGFQPDSLTLPDRYPVIFNFVQAQVGRETPARMLSFGCSTGEEVFTLRERFPAATIRGLDINPANIRTCLRRQRERGDAALSFARASSAQAEPPASYDVVFCMAVLRNGRLARQPPDCRPLFSFERFAAAIADLDRCLKPGGLLVIRYSNFRFLDTPTAAGYEVLFSPALPKSVFVPIYGPDNQLIPGKADPDAVFRKPPAGLG